MWISVILQADATRAEALSEALMEHGALSVSIDDADAGTDAEKPQFGEPGMHPASLWDHSRVVALFDTDIDLALIEAGLHSPLTGAQAEAALHDDLARIVTCAHETVVQAGIAASDISALYFTGGSTGLKLLTDQLEAAFPGARAARGDRMASVATGLGLHAARLFKA